MEEPPPTRRADRLSWAVFLVLAAVYHWGRCPSFGPADSPGAVLRALYHPGRDPLAWLGHAAARLPFDSPSGHVNALSGLFHAAAVALLFAVLRRLGLKRAPAIAASALLAFLPHYWYYALVAGRGPVAVVGLALAVWGVVTWKDEARAWPLAFAALGSALFIVYAPRAQSLIPSAQWAAALIAGLLIQRAGLRASGIPFALAAAFCSMAVARPYDARRHNPTLEWARAALETAKPGDSIVVADPGLRDALAYAAAEMGRSSPFEGPGEVLYEPVVAEHLLGDGYAPDGILVRQSRKPVSPAEAARRAAAALDLPALSSVGRRDRSKYGFTHEKILYAEYRAILSRYRDLLGPGETELRARLDAQLAEYAN